MRVLIITVSCMLGLCLICNGQNLTVINTTQQGNDVVVNYQLDGEKGKAYFVTLYASNNDFAAPLRLVQGDVATKRVLPGSGKTIRWRALDELKNFDGDISFEIRAVPAMPLFSNITPASPKVKRGKDITITWTGGIPTDEIVVELVKGDMIVPAGTLPNNGSLLFTVPKKMKTGKYKIQLSQAGELTSADGLDIKPKVPLLMKVLPVVVVGAVIILLNKPSGDEFPEPPDLTGN